MLANESMKDVSFCVILLYLNPHQQTDHIIHNWMMGREYTELLQDIPKYVLS